MKITCSKRDDIIKQRDEYQADYDRRKALYDEDDRRFRKAQYDQYHEVEEEIKRQLGVLQDGLNITVSGGWDRGLEVRINNGDNPHDDTHALAWNYSAKIGSDDGEVKAETGSWSGLNAVTAEQLENLRATVETLEAINAIDWKKLLDVATPEYNEYFKHKNPQWDKDKPDFSAMLLEADIEESIGKDVLFHRPEANSYSRNPYYKVLSETPKNYNVVEIANYYVTNEEYRNGKSLGEVVDQLSWNSKHIAKDKFRLALGKDYETVNY